jgi:transposase
MSTRYVNVDRATPLLLPADLREWVPTDDVVHLVIEAVEGMALSAARVNERGTGSAQYPPGMLLALLIYCYSQGLYSSRRIERASYTHLGVRYLTADTHPDHDTIATFRRQNAPLIRQAFVEVLQLAGALGVPRLGTVCVDGTKLKANASKRATRTEAELRAEVAALAREVDARLAQAEQADVQAPPQEQLPAELADRHKRRAKLQAARAALAARAAQQNRAPRDTDTGNPSDPASRLMPDAQGHFIQGYNAQLAVSAESGLIVAAHVCAETQDRQQLAPTIAAIPAVAGVPQTVVADAGYDHSAQIVAVQQRTGAAVYVPLVRAPGRRDPDHGRRRRAAVEERTRRQHQLDRTPAQRWLRVRRQVVEPVFGTLKHTWGFARFRLRGLAGVNVEWQLLAVAYNLCKLWRRPRALPA